MGIYWDNGKENGNYRDYGVYYRGYTGIMEKKMETTGDYIGIIGYVWGPGGYTTPIMENQMEKKMENEMETTISG